MDWTEIDEVTGKNGWPKSLQATYQKPGSYLVYVEGVPSPLFVESSDPEGSAPGWVRLRTSSAIYEEIEIRLDRIIAIGIPPADDPIAQIAADATVYQTSWDPFDGDS